jgi:DNA-binding transcriptional regulator LsrR (DeoR family)
MPKTLERVGYWYHVENLTQTEIAERLKIHQSNVSRMIKEHDTLFKKRYEALLAAEKGWM